MARNYTNTVDNAVLSTVTKWHLIIADYLLLQYMQETSNIIVCQITWTGNWCKYVQTPQFW